MGQFQKKFTCTCGKVHDALLDDYIEVNKGYWPELT